MSNQDFITFEPTGTGFTIVMDVSNSDDLPYKIDPGKLFNERQLSLNLGNLDNAKKFVRRLRGLLDCLETDILERQLESRLSSKFKLQEKDIESHSLDAKEKQSQL